MEILSHAKLPSLLAESRRKRTTTTHLTLRLMHMPHGQSRLRQCSSSFCLFLLGRSILYHHLLLRQGIPRIGRARDRSWTLTDLSTHVHQFGPVRPTRHMSEILLWICGIAAPGLDAYRNLTIHDLMAEESLN